MPSLNLSTTATFKSLSTLRIHTMFSRLVAFTTLALPLLAVATPAPNNGGSAPTTACCDSTIPVCQRLCQSCCTFADRLICKANSDAGTGILKSIGVSLSDLNVLLGLTCSPITVIGVGSGNSCSGTTVSCSNGVVLSYFMVYPCTCV